ncbi:hypothetical protein [Simkania sp.]|uniref:hypothetical protein n=1 Tax=Simkania sp. TaxID=34094 RepID=UPI003B519F8E
MYLPLDCPPLHTGVLLPEFFDKTFLPVHVMPVQDEGPMPLSYIFDRLAGVIKLPFLVMEAERIQEMLQRNHSNREESPWFSTVSICSNSVELICWLGERGYLEIALPTLSRLRKIYYVAKIILYNYAVLIDSELLYRARGEEKKEERAYMKLLLVSHMLYLSCMVLGLGSLTFGASCSRSLLRKLHFSSLLFDLASKSYEWRWGDTKDERIKSLTLHESKSNHTYG